MRYSSLVFLCTILFSSVAFTADSINVARGVPITINYAINDNPDLIPPINADPQAMVDGLTSTIYNLPAGQEGTAFLFDLGAEFQITTFVARGFAITNFRLRGYELEGSVDGVQWITMARDTNQLLLTATASFAPTSARFVKLTVTHMDPTRPNGVATVLSEINLWANIVFPTVYQVSLANTSSAGIRFRDVIWSSMLLDSSATVTLQYRKAGTSAAPTAVDTAIPNTGRYAWETALLLDGSYEIIVSPNGTGARVSGYGTATIDYFSNEALFLVDTAFYRYREPQYALDARTYYSTVTQAWGHSALNGDTLIFYWRFTPNVPRDYTCEFSYSTDSARTWIVLGHVPDTVAQPVRFAAPAPAQSSASTFYRVGFLAEGYEWSHAQTVVPIVLSSWPANLSARWEQVANYYPAYINGYMLAYTQPSGPTRIVAGKNWILDAAGSSLPGWESRSPMLARYAAGKTNISTPISIASSDYSSTIEITNEEKNEPHTVTTTSGSPGHIQLEDVDGDGSLEVIIGTKGRIEVYNDTLQFLERIMLPDTTFFPSHIGSADLGGDSGKEYVYTTSDRIYVASRGGAVLEGFPVQFAENISYWTLLVDFDKTGTPDLVFASTSRLYCYRPNGQARAGFPVQFSDVIDRILSPAIADIDGDGSLDIVVTARILHANVNQPDRHVWAISATGAVLEGWPAAIRGAIPYFANNLDDPTEAWTQTPRFSEGVLATPLIASIDGDATPEIVLSCSNGMLYVINANGTMREGYPVFLSNNHGETGVLGDFDGDGSLNYVIRVQREVYSPGAKLLCLDFGPGSFNPDALQWPMHMQNPERTGIAPQPVTSVAQDPVGLPETFALEQNHPNPFNPTTVIRYQLSVASRADLRVFDILGREVAVLANGVQSPGRYSVMFDASELPSGTYFCRLVAGESVAVRRMMLVK